MSRYTFIILAYLTGTVFFAQTNTNLRNQDRNQVQNRGKASHPASQQNKNQQNAKVYTRKELKEQHKLENFHREKQVKRDGRYAFGVSLGIIPDIGNLSSSGARLRQIRNEMARVAGLYNQTNSSAPSGFQSSGEINSATGALIGFPVMFSLSYYTRFFMYRVGLTYAFTFPAINEITVNQYTPGSTGQVSGLDTGGKDLTVKSSVRMSYFELSSTVAMRLVNVRSYSFYIGGGLSLFSGGWRRVTTKTQGVETIKIRGDIPDVDSFATTAIGYNFLLGGEIFIHPDIALTAELVFSRGYAVGKDEVVSSSLDTLQTSAPETAGVTDKETVKIGATGAETFGEASDIQYGGYALMFGVRYIL
ncbi:MAG: hypothetical protein D6767_05475 [Candidatus Hydrogenedentota bacterium]|nr:MAG: hypothetical protein D6767_05475 [Candidatus Hydrogenedentota bacterium]